MLSIVLLATDDCLKLGLIDELGQLQKAGVTYKHTPELFGAIVSAKILKVIPNMGGAFVEFRDFEGLLKEGFLKFLFPKKASHEECAQYSQINCNVWAEIDREAQKGKPFRLKPYFGSTADIPRKGISRLEEWGTTYPDADIVGNIEAVHWVRKDLRERFKIASNEQLRDFEEEFQMLMEGQVDLGDGWSAIIVPTPSLVAIDLNHTFGGTFQGNVDSLIKICDEIVKRDLSGSIFIDPAGISLSKRRALGKVFQEVLKEKKIPDYPRYEGVAPRGMIELYRPQKRCSVMAIKE